MLKIENQCVDCGLPCLGDSCKNRNTRVFYCDYCGDEGAGYRIDGEDFCGRCIQAYVDSVFHELTLSEQADILNINIQNTEDI